MNETAWIGVDLKSDDADQSSIETVRGVKVSVQISPYDRPLAFRGIYVKERGAFRIEFRYSDEEAGETHQVDGVVSVELGRHSHKLLAIEVAVDRHDIRVIELQLVKSALEKADETVRQLQSRERRPNARLNYRAIDEVLRQGKANPSLLVPA